jgi:enterochelin esterase-like enzyme
MIGIDSVDRLNELTYNHHFNSFIINELLPWIKKNYNVTTNPNDTTICGYSLGGLASLFIAF